MIKRQALRIFVGAIIATAAITISTMGILWLWGIGNDLQAVATLVSGLVSAMVAFLVVILWGLPVHFLFRWLKIYSFLWYGVAAFIPGPVFIFALKPFGEDENLYLLYQSVFCGLIGLIGAFSFWIYVVRNQNIINKDKTNK